MLSNGDVGWAAAWGLTFFAVTVSGGLNATSLAAQDSPPPTRASLTIELSDRPNAVLPPAVAFGEAPVGERVVEPVTLTNDGGSPFQVLGVAVDGEAFALGANGCGGKTLAPTESCVVEVIFEPQREGDFSGLLVLVFDGDESASVALTASAFLTSPTSTIAPPTSTVAAGGHHTVRLIHAADVGARQHRRRCIATGM